MFLNDDAKPEEIKKLLQRSGSKWILKKSKTVGVLEICFFNSKQELNTTYFGFVAGYWCPVTTDWVKNNEGNLNPYDYKMIQPYLFRLIANEFKARGLHYNIYDRFRFVDHLEEVCRNSDSNVKKTKREDEVTTSKRPKLVKVLSLVDGSIKLTSMSDDAMGYTETPTPKQKIQ